MARDGSHRVVLAASSGGDDAVAQVARTMGDLLGLPVRTVHVVPGLGPRGPARDAAFGRLWRGETSELVGRPVDVLSALARSDTVALAILGTRRHRLSTGARRGSGTALAVARRVGRPVLLVPPDVTGWPGPQRVLVPLDGSGTTALASAAALASIGRASRAVSTLHVLPVHDDVPPYATVPPVPRTASAQVVRGPVVPAILEASTRADLLVLVWSQRVSAGHGTVATAVLERTPVPVLLVPASVVPGTTSRAAPVPSAT